MEKFFIVILVLIYAIWSIRWGIRFVDGRWEILENSKYKWLKILTSIFVGILFGFVYLIYRGIKFIFHDFPRLIGS